MDKLRQQALVDALSSRIVVLDGAMGSILQARLRVEDYGGAHLENCTDNVSRANPGVVYAVHTSYLEAGADIIETNSFNGHPVSLGEFRSRPRPTTSTTQRPPWHAPPWTSIRRPAVSGG